MMYILQIQQKTQRVFYSVKCVFILFFFYLSNSFLSSLHLYIIPLQMVPTVSKMEEVRQIAERDPLTELHEQERKLIWSLRNTCRQKIPHLLPKLLQCVEWDNKAEVRSSGKTFCICLWSFDGVLLTLMSAFKCSQWLLGPLYFFFFFLFTKESIQQT